jgi:hypothetical protein
MEELSLNLNLKFKPNPKGNFIEVDEDEYGVKTGKRVIVPYNMLEKDIESTISDYKEDNLNPVRVGLTWFSFLKLLLYSFFSK